MWGPGMPMLTIIYLRVNRSLRSTNLRRCSDVGSCSIYCPTNCRKSGLKKNSRDGYGRSDVLCSSHNSISRSAGYWSNQSVHISFEHWVYYLTLEERHNLVYSHIISNLLFKCLLRYLGTKSEAYREISNKLLRHLLRNLLAPEAVFTQAYFDRIASFEGASWATASLAHLTAWVQDWRRESSMFSRKCLTYMAHIVE